VIRNLTDRTVAGLRSTGGVLTVTDRKTPGLALRIGTRTKVWYFAYRNGGPTRWLKLGEYPGLELADARDRAVKQRALLADKLDPVKEQEKAAAVLEPQPTAPIFTFAAFVPAFVAFQKGRKKTWEDDEAAIKRHLLPSWGSLPLKDITRRHVQERLDALVADGMTIGVNRIQALISRIFTVALDRSLVENNPAHRIIKRFSEQPRERVRTDAELRALWKGLDEHPGEASDAIRLRLLLGQRGEETSDALWNEIDLEAAIWSLPNTRTKNKRAHVVALPPEALTILKRRREAVPEDAPRVFPSLDLTGDEHKALNAIHNGAYEWTDLRRTVATRLAGLGFDETTIGRVLNHARYTVTGKHYNQHVYVEEIRQALTAWDRELRRVLTEKARSKSKVLPMRRRR
jgi:integrase